MPAPPEKFDKQTFLASVRARPGVYVFYQEDNAVLYVGKAVNLKNRLANYLRGDPARLSGKTRLLVSKIHRVETQQTRTESEALLLENNLIKAKRPKYNISLRDDKSFPYIRCTEHADFPRFAFYRGRRARNQRYYGPYPNATAVREMLAQLHKIFRLRQCTDAFFRNRSRPCLQYQIKRCSAPCVGYITAQKYRDDVRQAQAMLEGRDFALREELVEKMERASAKLDFETAAAYRDRIALLQRAASKQYVNTSGTGADADVVTVALESDLTCFSVVSIRRGRNLGARFHIQKNPLELTPPALLEAFLPQNYLDTPAHNIPAEILLGETISGRAALQQVLSLENQSKVTLKQTYRAHRARWVEAAQINCAEHLRTHLNQRSQMDAQFKALGDLFALDETPSRVECFDISHTMGERTVGACVVFDAHGPVKSDYRRFNIVTDSAPDTDDDTNADTNPDPNPNPNLATNIQPGDDYAAIEQTLLRRYKRIVQEDGKLPDLILIDGGKGQVRAAARVLEELQILENSALVGVSKGRARRPGEERLHPHARATIIPAKTSPALHLIQRIRDEAHRFAITGHRARRARARTESPLQHITGIGEKRRRNLLRHFGGLREITHAGIEDLSKAPGISPALAKRIYAQLHDPT